MPILDFLFPYVSVFALNAADIPAYEVTAAETTAPIILAQADEAVAEEIEDVSDVEEFDSSTGGLEAPYTAEIQPPAPTQKIETEAEASLVFTDKTDDEIFTIVTEYLQDIKTLQADFLQTAPSGNVTSGVLKLSRPGRLRFEYTPPTPTLIVATQGLVYVQDTDLETTDSYPVRKTPLKFLLSKKIKTDDVIVSEVLRGEDSVNLVLESSDEETEGQLILVLEAPNLKLKRWVVIDANNNYTLVDLENIEEDVDFSNRTFRIPEAGSSFTRDR